MTSLKLTCYSCRILNRFLWPFAFIIRSGLSSCIRYTPPARMSFPPLWSSAPSWCVSPVSTYLCLPCVFSPCAPGPLFQFVFVTCVKHSSFFLVLVFLVFKSLHIFFQPTIAQPFWIFCLAACLSLCPPEFFLFTGRCLCCALDSNLPVSGSYQKHWFENKNRCISLCVVAIFSFTKEKGEITAQSAR